MSDGYQICILPFDELTLRQLHAIYRVRGEVFVVGQKICAVCDVDELDPDCWHVLLTAEGEVVGTARLMELASGKVKVGRVAVLQAYRGRGYGRAIMQAIHGWFDGRTGAMSAQTYLEGWYAQMGWQAVGQPYMEAGVEHIEMRYAKP